jgi:hypothetical protein
LTCRRLDGPAKKNSDGAGSFLAGPEHREVGPDSSKVLRGPNWKQAPKCSLPQDTGLPRAFHRW